MTDQIPPSQEAVSRLERLAQSLIVDGTALDALGRFDATYGDLRALLAALSQAASAIERLEGELKDAGMYTEAHERLDALARERVAEAEARASSAEDERDEQVRQLIALRLSRLTHDDLCRLSVMFGRSSDLRTDQDIRINEWLKTQIADAKGTTEPVALAPTEVGWAGLIAAEFAKPQFMTTTADSGHYSLNFSFSGPDARERCHALEDAFLTAGRAINGRDNTPGVGGEGDRDAALANSAGALASERSPGAGQRKSDGGAA